MVDISSSRVEDIISAAKITRLVMEVAPEVLRSLAEGYTNDPAMVDLCDRFMFMKDNMRSYTMQVSKVIELRAQGQLLRLDP